MAEQGRSLFCLSPCPFSATAQCCHQVRQTTMTEAKQSCATRHGQAKCLETCIKKLWILPGKQTVGVGWKTEQGSRGWNKRTKRWLKLKEIHDDQRHKLIHFLHRSTVFFLKLNHIIIKTFTLYLRPKAINIIWSLLPLQTPALNFLQLKIYTLCQAELLPVPSGLGVCVFFALILSLSISLFVFFSDSLTLSLCLLFHCSLLGCSQLTASHLANTVLCSSVNLGRLLWVWCLQHVPHSTQCLFTPIQCSSHCTETVTYSNGISSSLDCQLLQERDNVTFTLYYSHYIILQCLVHSRYLITLQGGKEGRQEGRKEGRKEKKKVIGQVSKERIENYIWEFRFIIFYKSLL